MISIFFTKGRIIKDNILFIEAGKEINVNFRII
jgi:hypothetical protein